MYDRAPRTLSEPQKDIPQHVGPGAYEPHHRFTDRKPISGMIHSQVSFLYRVLIP